MGQARETMDRVTAAVMSGDRDALGQLYAADAVAETPDGPRLQGGAAIADYLLTFKRAFPDAMPVREEERVLLWLVAAARRLGGAVRTGERGTVLTPDVDAAIDLTVYTRGWLEPDEMLRVVQQVLKRKQAIIAKSLCCCSTW